MPNRKLKKVKKVIKKYTYKKGRRIIKVRQHTRTYYIKLKRKIKRHRRRKLRVAIVGSEEKKWSKEQKEKAKQVIREILTSSPNVILVSGGCHRGGVDIWAEEIADELGVKKIIFPAKIHRWGGKGGYRDRNIKIAETCDVLYDIEPKGKRSGGTWTANYAKKLGKPVYFIEIEGKETISPSLKRAYKRYKLKEYNISLEDWVNYVNEVRKYDKTSSLKELADRIKVDYGLFKEIAKHGKEGKR